MRGGLLIALVVTSVFAACGAMATAPARAQAAQDVSKIEFLVERINRRQQRQEKVMVVGFATVSILLLVLIIMIARRQPAATGTSAERQQNLGRQTPPGAAIRPLRRLFSCMNEIAIDWCKRVGHLRLSVYQAGMARRQKRIKYLLTEIEGHIASGADANQRFRQALDNFVQESARMDSDIRAAGGQKP